MTEINGTGICIFNFSIILGDKNRCKWNVAILKISPGVPKCSCHKNMLDKFICALKIFAFKWNNRKWSQGVFHDFELHGLEHHEGKTNDIEVDPFRVYRSFSQP